MVSYHTITIPQKWLLLSVSNFNQTKVECLFLHNAFHPKFAEEMERESSSSRQDNFLPEPEPEKSDLPVLRFGRTLKEMLASGRKCLPDDGVLEPVDVKLTQLINTV